MTQQLEAIRRRLTETVVPELPESAKFAREQVLLIDAALASVIECQEHEYRYAVLEHQDYRELLGELTRLTGTPDRDVLAVLDEAGPDTAAGAVPLTAITARTRRMKVLAERLHGELTSQATEQGSRAFGLMARLAARQVAREASWFRLAGFTKDSASIGQLLEESR
ncbi:hypothetical protein FPZ12_017205 [Amycolatopsis acidicola]|uniref:Uncharacterized protein n=1 Tax=Amycolatopsis acidicola TaxID=2596893 RepID=A0A5N0V3M1_9PSEU|nr:hypothetical protein [Amycolatopsis acidicola]KAA9160565.1 hypothetical protein FPZ12_017205 [Amycolatopsis acidicola]